MDITLIFPHQLFRSHPAVHDNRPVYLVEEFLFFRNYNFNKKKLVLHRASMKFYADHLIEKGISVNYIDSTDKLSDVRDLISHLANKGIEKIHYADVADDWLEKRLRHSCDKHNINLNKYRSPNFLNTAEDMADFFDHRKTYFQTDFYTRQRKERNILLEKDGKPIGGKWTYDSENRLRFPKNEVVPLLDVPKDNKYVCDAREWIDKHFGDNYGSTGSPFGNLGGFYPVTFKEGEKMAQ